MRNTSPDFGDGNDLISTVVELRMYTFIKLMVCTIKMHAVKEERERKRRVKETCEIRGKL